VHQVGNKFIVKHIEVIIIILLLFLSLLLLLLLHSQGNVENSFVRKCSSCWIFFI